MDADSGSGGDADAGNCGGVSVDIPKSSSNRSLTRIALRPISRAPPRNRTSIGD
jgi:hypothetical protein